MTEIQPLFLSLYKQKPGGLRTHHACCIPDDKILDSMRASGQTIYANGKEVKGKINRASLICTDTCPLHKKDCQHLSSKER